MPTIAELNQRHPSIDLEQRADYEALYRGGACFQKRLQKFLPPRPAEPSARYQLRKSEYHYRNYLGAIVGMFASMLYVSKPVVVASDDTGKKVEDPGEFYTSFRDDCDGNGTDLAAFMKERTLDAMVQKRGWWIVETPDGAGDFEGDRALARQLGINDSWLRALCPDDVYDWETDARGALEWVLVHTTLAKRNALSGGRKNITERWEHFLPDRVDTYEITYQSDKPPASTESVALVGSKKHRYAAVPVVCMEVPADLHIAERLSSPQLAHFRMSNAQTWSISASCYAMLVFKVADPDEFEKKTVGAGYGLAIGQEDSVEWVSPKGDHHAALDAEIKAQKDEIFRLAHQMALGVENNAAAVGRTAESKIEDSKSTRVVLLAYSDLVKEAIERTYDLIENARADGYSWSVEGLNEFAGMGTDAFVTLLTKIQAMGGIPSRTLLVWERQKLASDLAADMDEQTMATVKDEIEKNTRDDILDETPAEMEARVMFSEAGKLNAADDAGSDKKPPGIGQGSRPGQKSAPGGKRNGAGAAPSVAS